MSDLLIDSTRLVTRLMRGKAPTGIDRVCLAYVERYAPVARVVLHRGPFGIVLPRAPSMQLFSMLLRRGNSSGTQTGDAVVKSPLVRSGSSRHSGSLLLNMGHSGTERPGYADWLRRNRLRPIFMVHDLIPVTHPEYCRPLEAAKHARRMETMLRSAAAVVTNSRATLQALSEYADSRSLPMPPAMAAPLACPAFCGEQRSRPLAGQYFVMLSTIEPRKNHWLILHVWRRLIERFGEQAPRLVVIGQRGWECENVLDLLERCDTLRGFVIEKPGCSDAEVENYLRHAQALLFPSFVEGYGLPLIEALALGVPVLASDLPVFREVAGDIPEYLDPLDGKGWMDRIESYCSPQSRRRAAQLRRISRFRVPTWEAHFELFEGLLEQVC
jgi:glycosyltransferase involved in cell wall biosynthesis